MAPTHTKLCSPNPSPYMFSAMRRREKALPTVVELAAPSPPRRMPDVQLTVLRVFKKRVNKRTSLRSHETATCASTSTTTSTTRRGETSPSRDPPTEPAIINHGSPSGNLPPSQLPSRSTSPVIVRAHSPAPSGPSPTPIILQREQPTTSTTSKPGRPTTALGMSASRGSITSTSRGSKMDIVEEIKHRLEAFGGIVTRYGEQDGEPIFIKESRVTSTTEPDVVTHFWESFTSAPLDQPPDLSSYPDLAVGDVYCNIVKAAPPSVQMWLWTSDTNGTTGWKRAKEGTQREDGQRLTITPTRQQPSWVSSQWGVKQLHNPKKR
ncbi:hypothetical protein C8Q80DRAFT_1275522 [Daedaleopsis nitida]|nr:hypothetical protein C8Q80DRAFT_1275522 [Daedaleopsis nitida]